LKGGISLGPIKMPEVALLFSPMEYLKSAKGLEPDKKLAEEILAGIPALAQKPRKRKRAATTPIASGANLSTSRKKMNNTISTPSSHPDLEGVPALEAIGEATDIEIDAATGDMRKRQKHKHKSTRESTTSSACVVGSASSARICTEVGMGDDMRGSMRGGAKVVVDPTKSLPIPVVGKNLTTTDRIPPLRLTRPQKLKRHKPVHMEVVSLAFMNRHHTPAE
jgi:hypothetical protein